MKTKKQNLSQFSIFDSIEHLRQASQNFLSKCDKKLASPLINLFSQWEKLISVLITEHQLKSQEISELKSKYSTCKATESKLSLELNHKKAKEAEMLKEIQAINLHLEEGKEMWSKQIKKIEEVMQDQLRSKQKIEGLYQQRLSEIDKELDDIMHIHKQKLEAYQNIGEILPGLFSMEELLEEKRIALGEISSRQVREVKLSKVEGCDEDICDEDSQPEMNFDGLTGTQRLIFQRLLDLRKKVYKFKHDETTCSERSSDYSLPIDMKTISQEKFSIVEKIEDKLARTTEELLEDRRSELICNTAGIVFGLNGSQKYRNGLNDLLKSDKLSLTQRENIVFELINDKLTGKPESVNVLDSMQQEDWGDMSSIHGEGKGNEVSQELQSIFSKPSLNLSKVSISNKEIDSVSEIQDIFDKELEEYNEKIEAEENKDQEMSSMSILKDFTSTKTKPYEPSHKDPSILDAYDIVSPSNHNTMDQREPTGTLIIPKNLNLHYLPRSSRSRSNPRVTLVPEGPTSTSATSKVSKLSTTLKSSNHTKICNHSITDLSPHPPIAPSKPAHLKKPLPGHHKLPIMPKPPSECKKSQIKTFRNRSWQAVQPSNPARSSSPPSHKINSDIKSVSPGPALKFRLQRLKDPFISKLCKAKSKTKTKNQKPKQQKFDSQTS